MKNIALLVCVSIILFGCQNDAEVAEANKLQVKTEMTGNEQLLAKSGILKVEVSKTNGITPVSFSNDDVLSKFNEILLSATRESVVANVSDPEFHVKLIDEEGNNQRLQVWLGKKGDQSILMNVKDTHTIYTLTPAMSAQLQELIVK